MPRPTRAAANPRALDVAMFCREGASLRGQWRQAELARLAGSVRLGDDGFAEAAIEWAAAGHLQTRPGSAPQCVIELRAHTQTVLDCQRCLQPMVVPVQVERRFLFVEGEDEAARLDEELDDDVLALTARLDLRELVEDELLLALPLVPRHEVCPDLPAALHAPAAGQGEEASAEAAQPHPFAALAALRRPKG